MKELIRYSYRLGVYVSSYDLAKATGKMHQNLMTTVRRKYKHYIHYQIQNHRYYKNQKIYLLTSNIIQKINKNNVYDKLLEDMQKVQQEKNENLKKAVEKFFSKWS